MKGEGPCTGRLVDLWSLRARARASALLLGAGPSGGLVGQDEFNVNAK